MSLAHVHLTPQLVQAVREAVDILAVAEDHTRLQKRGRDYQGLCPLHKEKTPSFHVDPDRGLFYCFGCSRGGDAIKLHQELTGDDFPAAIEALARRFGVPLPTTAAARGERAEAGLEEVLELAALWFTERLKAEDAPRRYLERRRVPPELVEGFGLGYAPAGWRQLREALSPKVPLKRLEAAGLLARSPKRPDDPYDRFRHRLMFPIRTASGRLVGFGGRTLGDDQVKYLNTRETEQFQKGRILYGLQRAKRAIRESGRVLLVEGYFDVLGAAAAGLDTAVASMGTALTPEQARLLSRYADEVVVGYDGDEAGENAHRRALPMLLGQGLTVRRALFAAGSDPDALRLEAGAEALVEAVSTAPDAVRRELDRLIPGAVAEPREKARLAAAVQELLRSIPDQVLAFAYRRLAADRLGVPVGLLAERGRPARGESREGRAGSPAPAVLNEQEEKLLRTLLGAVKNAELHGGGLALPAALRELPPEAFWEEDHRSIYSALCALTEGSGASQTPSIGDLREWLERRGCSLDKFAGLVIESPVLSAIGEDELRGTVTFLLKRWRKQRQKELKRQLEEAQRTGDRARCEALAVEMSDLAHARHGHARAGGE